jgi:PAS domain S-box-containing protein
LIAAEAQAVRDHDRSCLIRSEGSREGVQMKPKTVKRQTKAAAPESVDEQDRYYVAMVESANIAFFTTALEGTIKIWNPGAARLFGYAAGETIGRNVSMLVPQDRREEIRSIQETIAAGGRLDNFVTARVGKSGQRIDVALTISPIKTNSGTPIGLSVVARDMTEQKITEDMFRLAFEACPAGMLMFD